jgi:hypothetical protein
MFIMNTRPEIPQKFMDLADKIYDRHSAYKSMYAIRLALEQDPVFKKKYDKYKASIKTNTGLRRWIQEDWIQVRPYLENNESVQCGRDDTLNRVPACRPLRRINKETPVTIGEILKRATKEEILEEVKKKEKDPDYRIRWVKKLYES